MILAYKTGLLMVVNLTRVTPKSKIVIGDDKRDIRVNQNENHRKLFDGENAVNDAIKWIQSQ